MPRHDMNHFHWLAPRRLWLSDESAAPKRIDFNSLDGQTKCLTNLNRGAVGKRRPPIPRLQRRSRDDWQLSARIRRKPA